MPIHNVIWMVFVVLSLLQVIQNLDIHNKGCNCPASSHQWCVLNWCVKGAEAWTTHGYVTVSGQSACLFSRKKCEAIQPNCEVLLLCLSLTSTELTDADVVMEIAPFDLCWRECLSGNPSCLTFGLHLGSTSGLYIWALNTWKTWHHPGGCCYVLC
jgi:hypothetical protein